MADLVDYLRDKLERARCACEWVDVTMLGDEYHRDMLNTDGCPEHPDRKIGDVRQSAHMPFRWWPR